MGVRTEDRREVEPGHQSDRLATWVFAAYVVVALPLVLFRLGQFRWFFSDDWSFLASGHLGSAKDLFEPHNAHWSTIPFIVYRALWHLVGLKSYVPYQAVALAIHVAVAAQLRLVALRAGARPWIATAMAGALVLFGPGSDDIVWAFQIGFTGALALGLAQLLLIDHDGGFDRRDALGVVAGLLGLMCSGVGVTMAIVVGLAALLRRGWKVAAVETVPLAAAYALYSLTQHPQTESPFGRPPIGTVLRWVVSGQVGTFRSLGYYGPVGVALVVLLIVGFALAWLAPVRTSSLVERSHRLAMPTALFVGGAAFSALTVQGRWQFGVEAAKSSRYLYLGAAFTLPALAVAAEELARRRRELLPVVIALVVVAIPANAAGFERAVYDDSYFDTQERILLTAPRVPFVDQVPAEVRPLPNPFIPPEVNVGFLRRAEREGRLPSAHGPLSPATVDEFRVRLGVAQRMITGYPRACREERGPLRVDPVRGEVLRVVGPVAVSIVDDTRTTPKVVFLPKNGQLLVAELPDLHLRIEPFGRASFTMCDPP
jgi:hypothetical protein